MRPLMAVKRFLQSKPGVANFTREILLTRVDGQVAYEDVVLDEPLEAHFAFIWLLPCVRPTMKLHRLFMAKRHGTQVALVRLLSCVNREVVRKG